MSSTFLRKTFPSFPQTTPPLLALPTLASAVDLDSATKLMDKSLIIQRKVFGERHPSYARSLAGCANLYARGGQFADALRLADQALSIRRDYYGQNHPDVADGLFVAAEILEKMSCYSLAVDCFKESHAISIRCGVDPSVAGYILERAADTQVVLGQFDNALVNLVLAAFAKRESLLRSLTQTGETDAGLE